MANQMGEASEGRPSGTGKPVNSIKHTQSKAVKSWINNELKQQQKRFKKILQNMEEICLLKGINGLLHSLTASPPEAPTSMATSGGLLPRRNCPRNPDASSG